MMNSQIPEPLSQVIDSAVQVGVMLFIAIFSSAVGYLYRVKEGQAFAFTSFFVNMAVAVVMAFFFDMIITAATPDINIKLEMASMVIIGISGNKLMELMQTKGVDYLAKKFLNLPKEKDEKIEKEDKTNFCG